LSFSSQNSGDRSGHGIAQIGRDAERHPNQTGSTLAGFPPGATVGFFRYRLF
jgi:hypothetical protein